MAASMKDIAGGMGMGGPAGMDDEEDEGFDVMQPKAPPAAPLNPNVNANPNPNPFGFGSGLPANPFGAPVGLPPNPYGNPNQNNNNANGGGGSGAGGNNINAANFGDLNF